MIEGSGFAEVIFSLRILIFVILGLIFLILKKIEYWFSKCRNKQHYNKQNDVVIPYTSLFHVSVYLPSESGKPHL